MKILKYNNPSAVDAVLKQRNPETFFSILKPSRAQIVFAFSTLSEYRVGELYEPAIFVCLGILQNAYKNPQYGVSIYSLSVADIYHAAKYLKLENEKIENDKARKEGEPEFTRKKFAENLDKRFKEEGLL